MTDPFVRPDVRTLLDYLGTLPGPKLHEVEPAVARQLTAATRGMVDLPVGELGKVVDAKTPGGIPVRLFDVREQREPGPAVAYFHGGGFVIGDIETHASFCAEMSRALDLPVISVDYRLAPEHPWPAAPEDCEAAARWIATSPAELGRTVTSLVVAGDSAGGKLAITTAMTLRDAPAQAPVIVQVPIYPCADLGGDYDSRDEFADGYVLTKAGMDYFEGHYAADLTDVRGSPMLADLAGMPPALIVTASLDPIRDQGRAYAAALTRAGVPVVFREAVGNIHGFITMRKAIPSAADDVASMLAALKPMIAEAEAARA
jgi:acetyl esterase